MNFEAVPCMFKQTVDGNESSYVGLLIRPSTQTSAPSNGASYPKQNGQNSDGQSPAAITSPSGNYPAARRPTANGNGYVNGGFYSPKQLQPRPTQEASYMQHQQCSSSQPAASCATSGSWNGTPQASSQQQQVLNQQSHHHQQQQHQQQQLHHQQQQQRTQWGGFDFEKAGCSSWGNSYPAETRYGGSPSQPDASFRNQQWQGNSQMPQLQSPQYPSSQWNGQQPSSTQNASVKRNSRNQVHSTSQVPPQISPDAFSPSHQPSNTAGGLPPISSIARQPLECSSTSTALGHYNGNGSGYASYAPSTPSQSFYTQQQQQQHYQQQNQMFPQQQQQQQQQQRQRMPPQYPQMAPQHFPHAADYARYSGSGGQWISPANSSATPDSGIQSIGDSPHSTNPYTPPIVSPYPIPCGEEREKPPPQTTPLDASDYADMPKLVPMNQMDAIEPEEEDFECGPPNIAGVAASPQVAARNIATPHSATPSVEIHAGMDTKEVTQQLVLTFGERRIKEMAELLHSQASGLPPRVTAAAPDSTTNGELFASPAPSLDDFCPAESYEAPATIEQKPQVDEKALKEKEAFEARRRLLEHRRRVREKTLWTFDRYLGDVEEGWDRFSVGKREGPEGKPAFEPVDWEAVETRLREREKKPEKEKPETEKETRKRKSSQGEKATEKKAKPGRKRKVDDASKYEKAPFTVQSTSGKKSSSERRLSTSKKARATTSERGHDYQKIRSNAIVDAPPRVDDSEPCECDSDCFCSETAQCFHRERHVECTPSNCTLHTVCQNRRIYNNQTISDLVKSTKEGQMCLRTGVDIHRGEYVCEYVGELVSRTRFETRFAADYSSWRHHYAMELVPGFVVDAYRRGNVSRFINHSCEPNCVAQTWIVSGLPRLGIFASREIQAGEELTIDYKDVHVALVTPATKCVCGAEQCRGFLVPPTEKEKPSTETLSSKQRRLVRSKQLFLLRNLRSRRRKREQPSRGHEKEKAALKRILNEVVEFGVKNDVFPRRRVPNIRYRVLLALRLAKKSCPLSELVERFDAVLRTQLELATYPGDRRRSESLRTHYTNLKKTSELFRTKGAKEKVVPSKTDLSYMDSEHPVGSYNPDESTLGLAESARPDEQDVVRCICGILDEDGTMVQCDRCHFWLHSDCLGKKQPKENEEFTCRFCERELRTTPAVDIVLRPQPEMRLEGCRYYRTLVNTRGIQVRINETVYVERLPDDKHKAALRKLHECVGKSGRKNSVSKKDVSKKATTVPVASGLFERRDLRIFRVERLFRGPNDEPFVFGCYYARPHETFCDSNRLFYRNELFWTPLFDTLPLEAVVGRCLVLEPSVFVEGRPKLPKYREEDVFICEYQIDKQQRSFEKINSKNRYYINTQHYVFDRFETPLQPKRDFTPFLVGTNRSAEKSEAKEKREATVRKLGADRLAAIVHRLGKSRQDA